MKNSSFVILSDAVRNAAKPLQKSVSIDDVANVSLFLIYPGLFFYQSAIGVLWIEPIFYGGWGSLMLLLFPILSLCYLVKVILDRQYIYKLEYIFFGFLLFISAVSIYFYMKGIPQGSVGDLLYWNLGGVISNLTCFLAFRLANVEKLSFKILLGFSAFCMLLIVLFNTDFGSLFFGFRKTQYGFSYQGFARSMLVVFLITCFSLRSGLLAFLCYCVFAIALVVNQSRTEIILFVCAIPATLIIVHRFFQNMKLLDLVYAGVALFGCVFLGLMFERFGIFDSLPYLRILALAEPMADDSFAQRLSQTNSALQTIKENPLFGDYGSYVNASSVGAYSHNFLGLWVNAGLIGVLFYLILYTMILWEVLKVKLTSQNYTLICLSGALGLSAIVAHLCAYVYVEVLLAAAIGSIAKMKEITDRGQSTPVNGEGPGAS